MSDDSAFKELIRRVRAGDGAAAQELVARYEPAIRRVARVRLGDARLRRMFDSMDIAQSVFGSFFVRAALGQYQLDKPQQLMNLLVDMSRKKLVDHARRQQAARRDYRRAEGGDAVLGVADPASSPSQHVEGEDLLRRFRERLSDEEKGLADDRAQGKDWADIAAARGGSPEALRKQLARAVDRVARELGLDD